MSSSTACEKTCSEATVQEENEVVLRNSIHEKLRHLTGFKVKNVLQNSTGRKVIFLRGSFESEEGEAVVILEKTAFSDENLLNGSGDYFPGNNHLEKKFQNDIYGDYSLTTDSVLNEIKTTIIHPASEQHFIKYSRENFYVVDETPEIYNAVILQYLEKNQFDLQWVYNILEHKQEAERIIFEDSDPDVGFVMLPDLKWNGEVDTLYLLAIINRRDLKSIRHLTQDHLPLLRNIQIKGTEAIKKVYQLDASQLRIYFHYHPSFYHLHVHFGFLRHESPGIYTEKAHLLSTVINNIELNPDYYQKSTIPFVVKENDGLFAKLEEHGALTKCRPL